MQRLVMQPLLPLLKLANPTMLTSASAAVGLVDLATSHLHPGERGYFTLTKKDQGSEESRDTGKQERLWTKSLEWARITQQDTALKTGSTS